MLYRAAVKPARPRSGRKAARKGVRLREWENKLVDYRAAFDRLGFQPLPFLPWLTLSKSKGPRWPIDYFAHGMERGQPGYGKCLDCHKGKASEIARRGLYLATVRAALEAENLKARLAKSATLSDELKKIDDGLKFVAKARFAVKPVNLHAAIPVEPLAPEPPARESAAPEAATKTEPAETEETIAPSGRVVTFIRSPEALRAFVGTDDAIGDARSKGRKANAWPHGGTGPIVADWPAVTKVEHAINGEAEKLDLARSEFLRTAPVLEGALRAARARILKRQREIDFHRNANLVTVAFIGALCDTWLYLTGNPPSPSGKRSSDAGKGGFPVFVNWAYDTLSIDEPPAVPWGLEKPPTKDFEHDTKSAVRRWKVERESLAARTFPAENAEGGEGVHVTSRDPEDKTQSDKMWREIIDRQNERARQRRAGWRGRLLTLDPWLRYLRESDDEHLRLISILYIEKNRDADHGFDWALRVRQRISRIAGCRREIVASPF